MVAHKSETDDSNCSEHSWGNYSEPFRRISSQLWCDVGSFNDNRYDNDDHAYEREARCTGKFVDVAVEGERIRYTYCAKGDNKLTVGEYR
jgi:hypothetical protein